MRSSRQRHKIKNLITPILAIAILFAPQITYAATIGIPADFLSISRSLVAWWTMDGKDMIPNARDRSGNGNNGNLVGFTSTTTSVGKIGQAITFDGADDYINVPANASLDNIWDGGGTVSFWLKPNSGGEAGAGYWLGNNEYILYGNNSSDPLDAGFEFDLTWSGGDARWRIPTANLTFGKWHHVSLVYNSDSTANDPVLYVDGSVVSLVEILAPTGTRLSDAGFSLQLGGNTATSRASDGSMDDVRMYSRALSASEVRQLYNLGSIRQAATPKDPLKSGLVGYWTMDGKDTNWNTNKANDLSGNVNTGTMINLATSTSPIVGKIGQGLNFNSSVLSYIDLGNPSSLDLSGSMSACAWVNLKSWPPTNDSGTIIANVGAGPIFQYFFGLNDQGDLAVTWSPDGSNFGGISDNTLTQIPLRKWSHVCFSRNGVSSGAIYYNGSPLSSTFTSFAAPTSAFGPVSIGGMAIGAGFNPLDGVIDDLRVYNRSLSATEIKQVYNLGSAKQNVSVPSNPATNGITGWWTFDGKDVIQNIRDSSGQGNNASLVGYTSTTTTVGKVGQALLFNGTSQYVTTASTPAPGSEFTVNAWVKPTSPDGYIVYRGDKSCCLSYGLVLSGGFAVFGVAVGPGGNADYQTNSASTINTSGRVWTMLTGVFSSSGNLTATYVNGVLDGTPDLGAGTIANSVPTTNIGADNAAANYFPGAIDDVRTYGRALSASEIMKLYKTGK